MKKMFLVSSFKDVSSIFEKFEENVKGKTVTFIPTASNVEKVVFYVNAGRKELEKLGMIIDELDISAASPKDIKDKLINNDYIYITGGNTFFLLQELKRTGTDQIIIEQVNNGKVYIGESAGAIITSQNIEYVKGMDNAKKAPNLEDYNALNLLSFSTVPHCDDFPFKKVAEKIIATYSDILDLKPINNKQAILVDDKDIRIETV
ncbi:MAG: Type 1 glutamine amidotransferase-like domain-containing protein [Bacilli bacterium]|nr:Type 1 glutamine amidotransferase-like domain-containing protein [Bacilli bacterium]